MKTAPVRRISVSRRSPRSKTTHELFDTTIQKTQVWLNDLMSQLGWENRPHKAYLALRTVLHALRDRLTVQEAVS